MAVHPTAAPRATTRSVVLIRFPVLLMLAPLQVSARPSGGHGLASRGLGF